MAERKPLSIPQIIAIAKRAGFNQSQAVTMAAIAMAESGGRYWAVGDNFKVAGATRNPKARYDQGLFQINSMHGYDPQRLISDPAYNAKAAFDIFTRQGFGAWTTFKAGAHKQFLGDAQTAGGTPAATGGETYTPAAAGGATVTAPAAAAPAPKKPQSDAEIMDYIRSTYPDVYGLLNVNGEVRKVMIDAARNGWDRARLQGALAKTTWWKKTAATARTWDADYATDKATGDALLEQTRADLRARAQRLGIAIDPKFINTMALNVRRLGWTEQQVMDSMAAKFDAGKGTAGVGQATVSGLRATAQQYGVEIGDPTLTQWTRQILAGTKDEAGFRAYLVKQAQGLFPSISDEISVDFSVTDYFDPYVQKAVRLGIVGNPAEVDLSDDKWRRALLQPDPATGKRLPMSLDTWETELRTNALYGWDQTRVGRQTAAQFATELRSVVGL